MSPTELSTVTVMEDMTNLGRHALKGEKVTFDARVNSISTAGAAGQLVLGLRVQQALLRAIVSSHDIGEAAWDKARKLTPESIVRVAGPIRLLHGEKASHDTDTAYAVEVTSLTVIGQASPNLPSFHRSSSSTSPPLALETRLDNRILDVRNAATGAIFKLHSGMCQLIVEFLCSHGFHWIHTPRIISATISGDNEYFSLPYFGREAWLAQSSQHHKQMALSMDMERVFEIGPVFRAEVKSSASARHMTEFTVLDIGMAFRDDYREVMGLIEEMLVFVFRGLQERRQYRQLIEVARGLYPSAGRFRVGLDEQGRVPRVSFLEAKRILREELGVETDDGKNFTDQEEAALGRHFRASSHLGQTDIFTIDQYPASMRQFNSKASAEGPGLSNAWDTVVGGREICSGSHRINSYDELCEAMRNNPCGPPLDPDAQKWQAYLTAFKAGMPQHGGCGLGVNRLLQGFLGLDDVREVTLFPRDVNRMAP
ncbi:aspartate-tRNA ligase [Bombardia bombarda]|uniref:aspartate--tRNA ligase n=1 Tax=Bombardia bombarda TaxID=252184 RepID=A0AA39WUE9_9PEZI|nr:aspartate-tRNA ligase [Bombardia bombarda]